MNSLQMPTDPLPPFRNDERYESLRASEKLVVRVLREAQREAGDPDAGLTRQEISERDGISHRTVARCVRSLLDADLATARYGGFGRAEQITLDWPRD